MSAPTPSAFSPILFQKNLSFLTGAGSAGIQIAGVTDPDVLYALVQDTPFPDRAIDLATIHLDVSGGTSVQFAGKNGTVAFQGGADSSGRIGVYTDTNSLFEAIGFDEDISQGLTDLSAINDSAFLLLRWGYDLKGSAEGSVALGATGSISFGVDGKKENAFAVVRRFAKANRSGARTEVIKTANSWMLPSQVKGIADLEPGTWLITEVDGGIALKLGAQYGYDFSWVGSLKTGALSGDMGLRVQLGIATTLGFQLDGKYAVVVERKSLAATDQQVRVRVFKLAKKGWDFAFNAGVSVDSKLTGLPSDFDGFIAAILGVHGAQFLRDIQTIEQWTDPKNPPPDLLAGAGVDYAVKLLTAITGKDPQTEFNFATNKLKDFLSVWNNLDHRAAAVVAKFVGDEAVLGRIRDMATQISQLDQPAIAGWIAGNLSKLGFAGSPELQWFESILLNGVLSPVADAKAYQDLKTTAGFTVKLLDGGEVQDVLARLQSWINEKLRLDWLQTQLDQATFDKLDLWLKTKLGQFLGKTLDLEGLEKIQQTVHALLDKRNEFYKKAVDALNRNCGASLAYTSQSSTTQSALVDVTFDFSAPNPDLGNLLHATVADGDLTDLLLSPAAGVTLQSGTLTHGIQRHNYLEIALPYYHLAVEHLNDSLARFTAVDASDGRLLLYDASSQDSVAAKNRSISTLGLAMSMPASGGRLTKHSTLGHYSYSWKQAIPQMRRAQLQYQVKPYVQTYWNPPDSFPGTGPSAGSFDTWVSDLDKVLDRNLQNATDEFGDTLLSLELSLPAETLAAWMTAPADKSASCYMEMSRRLQARLKQLIPFYYFSDPSHYQDVGATEGGPFALLVYSCLPPSTNIDVSGDRLIINKDHDVYWDWPDAELRREMIFCQVTQLNLGAELDRVKERLLATPSLQGLAGFYGRDQTGTILARAESPQLVGLLETESEIVRGAREAALALAKFRGDASGKPTNAIEALDSFTSRVTNTFNARISTVYGGGALRPLATMLFLEAARALDPTLAPGSPAALLRLAVYKSAKNISFPPIGFPSEAPPASAEVVLSQMISNLSA